MYIDEKFQSIIDSLTHAAAEAGGGNMGGAIAAIRAARNEIDDVWEEVSPSDEPGYRHDDSDELEEEEARLMQDAPLLGIACDED